MAMTTRSTLPAAEVDLLAEDADQVQVTSGSEAEPTVVAVAGRPHFRVLSEGRMVLYHRGDHIAPEHADAPTQTAELQGGTWVPKGRERKAPKPPDRATGQPTRQPRTAVLDTTTRR